MLSEAETETELQGLLENIIFELESHPEKYSTDLSLILSPAYIRTLEMETAAPKKAVMFGGHIGGVFRSFGYHAYVGGTYSPEQLRAIAQHLRVIFCKGTTYGDIGRSYIKAVNSTGLTIRLSFMSDPDYDKWTVAKLGV